MSRYEHSGTNYNIPNVYLVEACIDKARLQDTFNKLVSRHEILRTTYNIVDGSVVQRVNDGNNIKLVYSEINDETEVESLVEAFIRPFELETELPIRIGLIKINENKYILMVDIHHIAIDGLSMGIFWQEFQALYRGDELPPLKLQYKDYAAWEQKRCQSDVMELQGEYWRSVFEEEIPLLDMPTDYERPAIQSYEGDRVWIDLDAVKTDGLSLLCKETGTTMYMMLLSVLNVLLSKYTGQEDIIIGSPISGRVHQDVEHMLGMFVNTSVMRNKPEREKTFVEFLEEVKENALKAYKNQEYPFERLVEDVVSKRDMGHNPIFDVMFTMINRDELREEDSTNTLELRRYQKKHNTAKFDLTFSAVENKAGLSFGLEYCTKLYRKETAERLLTHLVCIIEIIQENRDIKLKDIDILTDAERHEILNVFNDTGVEYPNKTIVELFEEQVEKTPDEVAVIFEGRQLTYRELNKKANSLAHLLVSKGVVRNNIVGIMTERSFEMITGILGILKAGAAYLPIDPNYPSERISFILKDSSVDLLLSKIITNINQQI